MRLGACSNEVQHGLACSVLYATKLSELHTSIRNVCILVPCRHTRSDVVKT